MAANPQPTPDISAQIARFEAVIAAARAAGNPQAEVTNLINLGKYYYMVSQNPSSAQTCFETALTIVRQINAQPLELETLIGLGDCLYSSKKQGFEQYEQALALARALNDREHEAECLTRMGMVETKHNQAQPALSHLEQALAIAREINHLRQEAITLEHIGRLYSQIENYPLAVQALEQAATSYQSLGEEIYGWFPAYCFGLIVHSYYQQGDMQQATDYYNRGLKLARESSPPCDNAFISQFRHRLVSIAHQLEGQSWEGLE